MRSSLHILSGAVITIILSTGCAQSDDKNTTNESQAQPVPAVAPPRPQPLTSIQWIDSARNMGKIREGEKVEVTFRFKNTGTEQLVINNVSASCGCTVAEKPEEPIGPGKEGLIRAAFDSKGRTGQNHKTLTVYANTTASVYNLSFDVEVTPGK
jgi:hypothetical protein